MASKNNRINKQTLLRIGQINASESKTMIDEIRKTMIDQHLDLLIVQEPYCREQEICGFGLQIKTIQDLSQMPWTKINKIQAGIVVSNMKVTVTKIQQFCYTHFTCVQIVL